MKIYVKTLTGRTVTIEVESSDTIYNVRKKIQKKKGTPPSAQTLFFSGNPLDDFRTVAHYGIREKSKLLLRHGERMPRRFSSVASEIPAFPSSSPCSDLRAFGTSCWRPSIQSCCFAESPCFSGTRFVDLENKDALQRIAVTSHSQGQYRVTPGLNIEGKCTRSTCTAYAKRVISPKGFCAFDITTQGSFCSLCFCTIEASTCGFIDCEWMYSGRKRGSAVEITSEWQVAGDEYERFREAGNVADWEVLIITARPNPLPRPECVMCLRSMSWTQDHQSLECGCRFHRDCVAFWKVRETHCPTCRVEICSPNISTGGREGTPDISLEGREGMPDISLEGREGMPDISVEDREIRPSISMGATI